jgi:carboxymethylenebutenolidase
MGAAVNKSQTRQADPGVRDYKRRVLDETWFRRLPVNYFQRYLAEEFAEDFQERRISRRKALKLILSVTGSLAIANSFLAACTPQEPNTSIPAAATATTQPAAEAAPAISTTAAPTAAASATAAQAEPSATPAVARPPSAGVNATVSPDDPAVNASDVQFPGKDGAALMGYLARSIQGDARPVVLVCHENRGLTDYIRDVTRRLAKAGYAALAVDLLSRQGGSAKVGANAVPGALGNTPPAQFVQDFQSGWEYLKTQPFAQTERVGMVGFCFGGGVTWQVAANMPELRAAVPFYGPQPPPEDVPGIQAAVLAIYGGKDSRIDAGIPAIEEAMEKNNKIFEKIIYPEADHAFHNDTGTRYNPQAAEDAWAQTLAWFSKYLA